jgi:hypothetical protein
MLKYKCRTCKQYKSRIPTSNTNRNGVLIRVDENGNRWVGRTCPDCFAAKPKQRKRIYSCEECYKIVKGVNPEGICAKCVDELGTLNKMPKQKKYNKKCIMCKNDTGHNYFFCYEHSIDLDDGIFQGFVLV